MLEGKRCPFSKQLRHSFEFLTPNLFDLRCNPIIRHERADPCAPRIPNYRPIVELYDLVGIAFIEAPIL